VNWRAEHWPGTPRVVDASGAIQHAGDSLTEAVSTVNHSGVGNF
jgi:hypothetical protein